jgi:hypothetical protein
MGIICHLGRNTDHGHYACHLKKDDQWTFFNDEKVSLSLLFVPSVRLFNFWSVGRSLKKTSPQRWVHVSLQE